MKKPTLRNINRSQENYINLLLHFKEQVQDENLSVTQICALLDEVKCFWLKQLKSIEFELDELAESKTCFVLSGAIFLNVSEYEHYFFKSIGDCHIISDPFSKFEMIFRHPEDEINTSFTVDYFKRAFLDTLEILTTYKGYFYILPIQEIAVDDLEQHHEIVNMLFWKFISSAFNNKFSSHEEFYEKYKSFEEIEAGLNEYLRENLVFNQISERHLPLREKIENVSNQYKNITSTMDFQSDAHKFLVAVFSYIAQVADILYVCSILRLNPYIRFDITFTYLTLVMSVFTDDENLKSMIEKTLICYVFYEIIDERKFENITFSDYIMRLKDKPLLNLVLDEIHTQKIDIFKDETSKVAQIIEEKFNIVLAMP